MTIEAMKAAVADAEKVIDTMGRGLAKALSENGKLSRKLLDAHQPPAFELARSLAELAAARAMVGYAEKFDRDLERGLAAVTVATMVRTLAQTLAFDLDNFGVSAADVKTLHDHEAWVSKTLGAEHIDKLADEMLDRQVDRGGSYGLDEHTEYAQIFARFADDRIEPLAEEIHRHDLVIPEDLLSDLADLGVFGISIPEEYGGHFFDHLTMCIATEELSRASLGAGGSVITRPEICAKAILKGGTEEQKHKWLPVISSGERIVCIAVTEPNAGSDVASLRVSAKPTEGGYLLNGEKTWCTFAGRADLLLVLARTGTAADGHRGLTLLLTEKPVSSREGNMAKFLHEQPNGGRIEGHAIPTIGYRGMHSYTVTFEDYFVPEENRIGDEGKGFVLQMQGFAGGRIQTAARAVGVMEAALRKAIDYATERVVFGKPLSAFSLPRHKLVMMAAEVQACRQLSYHVAHLMDEGGGDMEASLIKLHACKQAECITREAMQLHGGMGYSEEYAVSRYWEDARVLSIFEGAEEVLALYVVARQYLRSLVK